MKPNTRQDAKPVPELTAEQEAKVRAATFWVQQLGRALKTCRLYDAANPTVTRFRQELAAGLQKLTSEHGAIALRFSAEEIECEGVQVCSAKSRDDNLALPFHRDGVRNLTFLPGIEPAEVNALLDAVLKVTGPICVSGSGREEDDLVTLLWQAHLEHVDVDYVPGEGDLVGGAGEAEGVPWPTAGAAQVQESVTPEGQGSAPVEAPSATEETRSSGPERSDDWSVGEQTAAIEASFDVLEHLAGAEVDRFRNEYEVERRPALVDSALALAHAYLASGVRLEDRNELARFLPRVLRLALATGAWSRACEAMDLLAAETGSGWSNESLAQELMQPISIANLREQLDAQDPPQVDAFVGFVRRLGDPAPDLLFLVHGESQSPKHQRLIAAAIIELCRSNPERLAPALADPRPAVVRAAVEMLGAIADPRSVNLLKGAAGHPEPRVRHEVVNALRQIDLAHARPLLLQMLKGADARLFCLILSRLSEARDAETAGLVLSYLMADGFDQRPADEQRAIYNSLAATAGDEVLPTLEDELNKGSWFSKQNEAHRLAVARCIARIGSPQAKATLERGLRSKRGPVRKACEIALGSVIRRD